MLEKALKVLCITVESEVREISKYLPSTYAYSQ